MADWIVWLAAGILLAAGGIDVFVTPFLIGQKRPSQYYTASGWLVSIIVAALLVIVCGRAFGWW